MSPETPHEWAMRAPTDPAAISRWLKQAPSLDERGALERAYGELRPDPSGATLPAHMAPVVSAQPTPPARSLGELAIELTALREGMKDGIIRREKRLVANLMTVIDHLSGRILALEEQATRP